MNVFPFLRSAARRTIVLAATAAIGLSMMSPVSAQSGDSAGAVTDLAIVSGSRQLSNAEIRVFDVTDTATGRQALEAARSRSEGMSKRGASYRVFDFGYQQFVIDASTPITVREGRNAAGQLVHEVVPIALPPGVVARAGYSVPPSSAWRYANSNYFNNTLDTWYREIWWTITKADDWRACGGCTAYDYWRIHGKFRAATLQGTGPNDGYKRAWIEFDRTNTGWSTPTSFEPAEPKESYAGVANQTRTYGFGTTYTVNLGVPPLTASGAVENSYGGSMTKSSENWHPVIRAEIGSGGVQWCRYETAEFTGTKFITTRVSARISSTGSMGGWAVLYGMSQTTSGCPTQI